VECTLFLLYLGGINLNTATMKVFIKLLILITLIACIGPFFLKGPDGKALLNIEKIHFPRLPLWTEIKNKSRRFFGWDGIQPNLQVYKWVDEKGITHYSDQSDPHYKSKLTEIQPLNIVPTHKSKVPEKPEDSDVSIGLTTIPLQSIPRLINDTKQVKKMMEGREKQIEQVLSNQ